ncbi:MAG: type II toxin-antitoxin system RelE/ParE family toxin [Brevundimonas sp.]|uniref:type II toxin-antitoxin system RelE/ParE family toxin n=1 Tax=Brevundimonas sp. TaxID=1871086 RepID=UPI0026276F3E|nr:type II toxin-antitoxin system RelE/ParE family toxin [Brevundimonas sp.]MDI6623399.1 type II toxin-antitoxin system RelE/ParE family toxin [Brevundimonas sp.]MDQ7811783.1 type II toxin-antitoxin system RelE/ParE family toxin [Brevundimonas sp.]
MTLTLSARAERDLAEQIEWLTERSPQAARKATTRILHVFDLLEENPFIGAETERGWREKGVRFGRDGYVICYVVRRRDVFVARFRHGRQDRR